MNRQGAKKFAPVAVFMRDMAFLRTNEVRVKRYFDPVIILIRDEGGC